MSTTKQKLLTAGDLLRMDREEARGELIRGALCRTMPAGQEHGAIAARLTIRLGMFVESHGMGFVTASETGVWLEQDPDTVRAPDMAYFSTERVPPGTRARGFSEAVPDLVAEVTSPRDPRRAMHDKALMWLGHGVRLVWVVHPDTRTVDVHHQGSRVLTLTEDDILDGLDVLPGFTCAVRQVFEG